MISNPANLDLYTEDFFKTIFNTATESWVLTNKTGNIVMVNPITEQMFGYKEKELIGKKVEVLMPKSGREEHVPLRNSYVKHPRKRPHGIGVEVLGLHKDEHTFPVEISLNYYRKEDEIYALAVIIDITQRKQKEKQLQEALLLVEKLKHEKVQTELKVLKNQVSPHYFFNSLSVLVPLISIDPIKSQEFTERLANTYRYILEIRDKLTVTVEEELSFIKDYEFLQLARFGEKFVINYNIKDTDLNKKIIPFSIQILLENVFKHNALYKDKKINIDINSVTGGIQVENNINKRIESTVKSLGIGLKNINNQYEYLSDLKPKFKENENLYQAWIPFINIKN
ncbi:hypothetical protein BFR04_15870 [Gaetbulibacter sp. 4G1]|nr:PAS domain S-box protein [Gaetbulibacter sp. 4G1]PIA80686.1 hypothetical protein BFR04_15870 [Gaetbulibacter sp. 4G1]